MDKKAIKGLFGWLEEITTHKTSISDISEDSWKDFNAFMIHRYISQYQPYTEIANMAQKFHYTEQKQIYSFYKEFIPKNNKWNKYIKSKTKQPNKDLVEHIKNYFECSSKEAREYINILGNQEVSRILNQIGLEKKEIKPLLK